MSKLIDEKPASTSILPETITIPDEEFVDELLESPSSPSISRTCSSSRPATPSGRRRRHPSQGTIDSSSPSSKRGKFVETRDSLHSPSVHNLSESDEENENGESAPGEYQIPPKPIEKEMITVDLSGESNTSSSQTNSRMLTLNNYEEEERRPKSTGVKSHHSLDWNQNLGVPEIFWKKHQHWADRIKPMCSPDDLDFWTTQKNLDHISEEIAPWYTTAWPINPWDRRYFSFEDEDGSTWVSRTKAQAKPFFLRGKPIDPKDRCVISTCKKLLISDSHVFMPVYLFSEDPSKKVIWQWQESTEKACYFHFRSKEKCKFIPGRNPYRFNVIKSQESEVPSVKTSQANIEVPDE